jgi:hypothetical protein
MLISQILDGWAVGVVGIYTDPDLNPYHQGSDHQDP